MNNLDSPSTSHQAGNGQIRFNVESDIIGVDKLFYLRRWEEVASVLEQLNSSILWEPRYTVLPRYRHTPKCSVENCVNGLPVFLARLPTNVELAFHCLHSSISKIIIQNRLMSKLFNKAVLTRNFVGTQSCLKEFPQSVVDNFPFWMCEKHFVCSPEYYSVILETRKVRPLLVSNLPEQATSNSTDVGQLHQRSYLFQRLGLSDSEILPSISQESTPMGKPISTRKNISDIQICTIEDCTANDPIIACDFKMIPIPSNLAKFKKWERAILIGLQKDFRLPIHGYLCEQHFSNIALNINEQEEPSFFYSIRDTNSPKPVCLLPSCANRKTRPKNVKYIPLPTSSHERNSWISKMCNIDPSFVSSNRISNSLEWLCDKHYAEVAILDNVQPILETDEDDEVTILGSTLKTPIPNKDNLTVEGLSSMKLKCCYETQSVIIRLGRLQEKSFTLYKLLTSLFNIYGLSPPQDIGFDEIVDNIKMYGEFGGDEIVSSIATALSGMDDLLLEAESGVSELKSSVQCLSTECATQMTIADALAGLMAQK